jgi:hypothetical protein
MLILEELLSTTVETFFHNRLTLSDKIWYLLCFPGKDERWLNWQILNCLQQTSIDSNLCHSQDMIQSEKINNIGIRFKLRNKSWKPECVLSFNMGWRILVFYPEPEARDKIY